MATGRPLLRNRAAFSPCAPHPARHRMVGSVAPTHPRSRSCGGLFTATLQLAPTCPRPGPQLAVAEGAW